MPFDFLRRKKEAPADAESAEAPAPPTAAGPGVPFEGMTEDWRLVGRMLVDGSPVRRAQPAASRSP